MKKLIEELNLAANLYYNTGKSPLTDIEYDMKLMQLIQMEKESGIVYSNSPTNKVGYTVLNGLNKINISDKPMLSLDKVHTTEEIKDFLKEKNYVVSIKCDGLSTRLIYEDGKLVSANTRGDSLEGADITEHIKYFLNVPLVINKSGRYIIDGETVILAKDFEIVNKNGEFKNPRNTAAGALALLDMKEVKSRRLSFIAWDVIEDIDATNSYAENLTKATLLGFDVVFFCASADNSENTFDGFNSLIMDKAEILGIPCDGVVYKFDDIEYGNSLGKTSHHFNNGIAWKPAIETVESELIDIDYDVSRNGILTPVAIFKPVELDGSTVERASLHNLNIMEELLDKPFVGQKVTIYKANLIIPQIFSGSKPTGEEEFIEILDTCPICGGPLKIRTSESGTRTLECPNVSCAGRISNRITHFVSKVGLDIKGLSSMTIDKLLDWEYISTLPDIYKLASHRTQWMQKPGFGPKSVDNILNAIEASRQNCELYKFISALGIPLVGLNTSKVICKGINTFDEFIKRVEDKTFHFTDLPDIGDETQRAIRSFDYSEAKEIASYLNFNTNIEKENNSSNLVAGKTFVITGKSSLGSRDKVKQLIEQAGGKVTGSVSAKTNYLVANAKEDTSKYNDAIKYNTLIINDEELIKILNGEK